MGSSPTLVSIPFAGNCSQHLASITTSLISDWRKSPDRVASCSCCRPGARRESSPRGDTHQTRATTDDDCVVKMWCYVVLLLVLFVVCVKGDMCCDFLCWDTMRLYRYIDFYYCLCCVEVNNWLCVCLIVIKIRQESSQIHFIYKTNDNKYLITIFVLLALLTFCYAWPIAVTTYNHIHPFPIYGTHCYYSHLFTLCPYSTTVWSKMRFLSCSRSKHIVRRGHVSTFAWTHLDEGHFTSDLEASLGSRQSALQALEQSISGMSVNCSICPYFMFDSARAVASLTPKWVK